jgi:tungstate transport system ATP-binding protein
MATSSGPLLEACDLQLVRGRRTVLQVPHLALAAGARLALVGPNGAGKSTLLETLALLHRPAKGVVRVAGAPVRWEPGELVRLRRRMAVVFQRPLLLRGSLLDNAALGLRLRGVPVAAARAAVRPWLEQLGIAHLADRPAGRVSVGEAQRASLARALALDPDVLLLDEPFAALDSLARRQLMLDLAALLAERPCAVVLVTHDWREVRHLAERVAVLFGGQVAQVGRVADVEARPAGEAVAALIAAAS